MKYFIAIIIFLHGAIHIMGFVKAFQLARIEQLSQPISQAAGLFWLLAALVFFATGLGYLLETSWWYKLGLAALVISSVLIIMAWRDAKYGMIANGIVLVLTLFGYAAANFYQGFSADVVSALQQSETFPSAVLTEPDIAELPEPVKRYVRFSGAIGKPIPRSFRAEMSGAIRKTGDSAWMPLNIVQYSFLEPAQRFFYMDASMMKLPVSGYHRFADGKASMDIRLFSLIPVQFQEGKEMDVAETVTFFNDICVMAPGSLIDERISWVQTQENRVMAAFTNKGITIRAWLIFNDAGELINFISDDRYAFDEKMGMQKIPWRTPIKQYQSIAGQKLFSSAEAVYNYPEKDFCYAKFELKAMDYNPGKFY